MGLHGDIEEDVGGFYHLGLGEDEIPLLAPEGLVAEFRCGDCPPGGGFQRRQPGWGGGEPFIEFLPEPEIRKQVGLDRCPRHGIHANPEREGVPGHAKAAQPARTRHGIAVAIGLDRLGNDPGFLGGRALQLLEVAQELVRGGGPVLLCQPRADFQEIAGPELIQRDL